MAVANSLRAGALAATAAAAAFCIIGGAAPARHLADEPAPDAATKTPDARETDRAAIRASMDGFTRAFASRDPKAMAALWAAGGEFTNVDGLTIRGRDALAAAFVKFFARTPEVSAEVRPAALRFLSESAAIEEGTVAVRRGRTESASAANYSALFVRENGRWFLARLSESTKDEDSIEDLAWLVGEWRSAGGQGAEILTTYSWAPNRKFIHAQFTVKEKGLSLSGSQVIGVNPATGALHTWTFEADGGVGNSEWSSDGDHWVLKAAGAGPDGGSLVETNILRRVDADTFTFQSIDRLLDDAELADLAPVKVMRVKSAK